MSHYAVIGAGFGDEGKGKVVSHLCSRYPSSLVVRFSGGQQAGHKVVVDLENGLEHIFSNFGSGTLQGLPTYWSKYCTVDPVGILNEYAVLQEKGVRPTLYLDELCPVTTPYEKDFNKQADIRNGHGSCCVGVGQTYQREEDHYSLTVYDLQYSWVLQQKLKTIAGYYGNPDMELTGFLENCRILMKSNFIKIVNSVPQAGNSTIFEGSQGLLLDPILGFFPHVTRSNIGLKNIIEMGYSPEVYLVTRAYQTRHGNGPISNEELYFQIDNPYEHNSSDGAQGEFRVTPLDLTLLRYAIYKDQYIRNSKKTLVITCMDVMNGYAFTKDYQLYKYSHEEMYVDAIRNYLKIDNILISRSPLPIL